MHIFQVLFPSDFVIILLYTLPHACHRPPPPHTPKFVTLIWGGAGKSLALPGRKQATVTKIGIYSTYSPRSSIHFLARWSNFCKPLKRNSEGYLYNQVFAATMTSTSDKKLRPSNCFFQSRELVVVRWGQIRRIGWVIKTLEAQVRQFLLGCKWPVRRGIVTQEQDPLGDLTAAGIFPSRCSSIAPAEMSNTRCWQLGILGYNQWGGCRLDSPKSRQELF